MNRQPKARPAKAGRVSLKTKTSNYLENNTKDQSKQVAIPGTALAALLKRYRRDLLNCEESREVSQALDCVDGLLMLVEAKP